MAVKTWMRCECGHSGWEHLAFEPGPPMTKCHACDCARFRGVVHTAPAK